MRFRLLPALLASALILFGEGAQACHQPPPPMTGDRSGPTLTPGDFQARWGVDRQGLEDLFRPVPKQELAEYEGGKAPPEPVEELLPLVAYSGHFDDQVLEAAMRHFRANAKAPESLAAILSDPKAPLPQKVQAAYVLGELGATKGVAALRKTLETEQDPTLKAFAARGLALIREPEGVKDAVGYAMERREGEAGRCLVILSLGGCPVPVAREALASLAVKPPKEESQLVRRCALAALGNGASAEDLILLESALADRDAQVRTGAVLGLGIAGGKGELLRRRLQGEEKDATCRAVCAMALGIRPEPASRTVLLQVLEKESDATVAGCAASALSRYGKDVVKPLGEATARHRHCLVKYHAALSLGRVGLPEAEPYLVELLSNQHVFGSAASGAAGLQLLGKISKPAPLLEALANPKHATVRQYAALAVGTLRVPGALSALQACLDDKALEVRRSAAVALAVYADKTTLPRLETLTQKDKDVTVRVCGALAQDILLQDDPRRMLALARLFKTETQFGSPRSPNAWEMSHALNRNLPPEYRLALALWDMPQVPPGRGGGGGMGGGMPR